MTDVQMPFRSSSDAFTQPLPRMSSAQTPDQAQLSQNGQTDMKTLLYLGNRASNMEKEKYLRLIRETVCSHDSLSYYGENANFSKPLRKITLRGETWKALIGSGCNYEKYIQLLEIVKHKLKNAKSLKEKVDNDVPRTFKNSAFATIEQYSALKRILMAFHAEHGNISHVQGMNTIAGTLLCVMPEIDAYFCYEKLLTQYIPMCFEDHIVGTYCGMALALVSLEILDPELFNHLRQGSDNFDKLAGIMQNIMSFGASSRDISRHLCLWDIMVALGFGLNVLICISKLMLYRTEFLSISNPCSLLYDNQYESKYLQDPEETRKIKLVLFNSIGRLIYHGDGKLFDLIQRHPIVDIREELSCFPTAQRYLSTINVI